MGPLLHVETQVPLKQLFTYFHKQHKRKKSMLLRNPCLATFPFDISKLMEFKKKKEITRSSRYNIELGDKILKKLLYTWIGIIRCLNRGRFGMWIPFANLHTSKELPRNPRGLKNKAEEGGGILLVLRKAQTKRLFFLHDFSPCTPSLGRGVNSQFPLTQIK